MQIEKEVYSERKRKKKRRESDLKLKLFFNNVNQDKYDEVYRMVE